MEEALAHKVLGRARLLVEGEAVFEYDIPVKDYFDRLITLWCEKMHTISKRLTGTVWTEEGTEAWETAMRKVKEIYAKGMDTCIESSPGSRLLSVVSKSGDFSQSAFFLVAEPDSLSCLFLPFCCDAGLFPITPKPFLIRCKEVDSRRFTLSVLVSEENGLEEFEWFKEWAFPTLLKWFRTIQLDKKMCRTNRLIDIQGYSSTYRHLKEAEGRRLAEKWTESTDPQKFVFEDCAIAAYLIELWTATGKRPHRFADLGCGNGLLVYLLNSAGYTGYGLDVRRRDIWSTLLSSADLREQAVDPLAEDMGLPRPPPDFLIGNHTDELTPWLPVLAARLQCDFLLIPCCPFSFYGKFNTRQKAPDRPGQLSVYNSFLQFVRNVAVELGFELEEDRLSIPSTKRLCFVGRVPEGGLPADVETVIEKLTHRNEAHFVPRPKEIQNRNCGNIPRDVQAAITKKIFDVLLNTETPLNNGWNAGKKLCLAEVNALLTEEERKHMKAQHGGLQTFLRNQHQVFLVRDGMARIRDWRDEESNEPRRKKPRKEGKETARVAECWMHRHHPQGCPLTADSCKFAH